MESVYLLIEREFLKTNENIYKIGRTTQINDKRIKQYPKGSQLIMLVTVANCIFIENEIKLLFKQRYTQRKDIGIEYFEGNCINMRNDIFDIIMKYDNLKMDEIQELTNTRVQFRLLQFEIVKNAKQKIELTAIKLEKETKQKAKYEELAAIKLEKRLNKKLNMKNWLRLNWKKRLNKKLNMKNWLRLNWKKKSNKKPKIY